MERMLIQAQEEKDRRKSQKKDASESSEGSEISIDPKTYCKLGHFHLLLEDYAKGISRDIT